jgi:hypothetical protein
MTTSRRLLVVGLAVALIVSACSGDSSSDTSAASSSGGDQSATTAPSPEAPSEEALAPSGVPLLALLDHIDVLGPPENGAGDVPLFSWDPFAGSTIYDLAVLGPDGPLWGWSGEETEIRLGGLPFDRPPGVVGPVLAAGSCWSVVARDGAGHVVAASDFLPVSPADSTGHRCVAGVGPQAGAG